MDKKWGIGIVVVAILFVFFFPFGSLISTGNPVKSLDGTNLPSDRGWRDCWCDWWK